MKKITFNCPICSQEITMELDEDKILNAHHFPVTVSNIHGNPEHTVTLFIDHDFRIRAIEASDITARLNEMRATRTPLTEQYIPIAKHGKLDLSKLTRDEAIIVSLADGKTSVDDIAKILKKSPFEIKLIAERLVRMKYLERVEKVIVE